MSKLPEITLTVEAKPWPKNHVARIASMRIGAGMPLARKKLQSEVVASDKGFLTEEKYNRGHAAYHVDRLQLYHEEKRRCCSSL